MLADEEALTEVLGVQVERQRAPESLRRPKRTCEELLASSSRGLSQSEMYAATADRVSMERLAERCPRGFAPFAKRVRDL